MEQKQLTGEQQRFWAGLGNLNATCDTCKWSIGTGFSKGCRIREVLTGEIHCDGRNRWLKKHYDDNPSDIIQPKDTDIDYWEKRPNILCDVEE